MSRRSFRHWLLGVVLAAGGAVALPALAAEPAPVHAEMAAASDAEPAHEELAEDHEHHVPTIDEYNFWYGFLGERDDVEPNILWRPKGTPVPFGDAAEQRDPLLPAGPLCQEADRRGAQVA
ncbi:MAG: hypothetical protein ABIQ16_21740 [Polyangiaceae bacterium]